jgi:hypothetical protein
MMYWGQTYFPPPFSTNRGCKGSTQSAEEPTFGMVSRHVVVLLLAGTIAGDGLIMALAGDGARRSCTLVQ